MHVTDSILEYNCNVMFVKEGKWKYFLLGSNVIGDHS